MVPDTTFSHILCTIHSKISSTLSSKYPKFKHVLLQYHPRPRYHYLSHRFLYQLSNLYSCFCSHLPLSPTPNIRHPSRVTFSRHKSSYVTHYTKPSGGSRIWLRIKDREGLTKLGPQQLLQQQALPVTFCCSFNTTAWPSFNLLSIFQPKWLCLAWSSPSLHPGLCSDITWSESPTWTHHKKLQVFLLSALSLPDYTLHIHLFVYYIPRPEHKLHDGMDFVWSTWNSTWHTASAQ